MIVPVIAVVSCDYNGFDTRIVIDDVKNNCSPFSRICGGYRSRRHLRDVLSYRVLNQLGSFVLPFPDSRGRHYLQFFPGRKLLLELDVHLLLQLPEVIRFLDVPENVLDERVQDVQTMNLVTLCDGKIKADQRHHVGL